MLILTRRIGEGIIANPNTTDQISFKILGVNGAQIRVGIDAPQHITVNRDEIQERIDAEDEGIINHNK